MNTFRALFIDRVDDQIKTDIRETRLDQLDQTRDVLVRVQYSSLNYKDGLAVTGKGKIIRGSYPFIPGIDLVGEVIEGADTWRVGDRVIATGWGLGEEFWGGFSQVQRVSSSALVRVPEEMDPLGAMTAGTAGLTAMLSVMALQEHGLTPDGGDVVVTGASGGVGSFAVYLLSRSGFQVVASTGKAKAHGYLRDLGASSIINRDELSAGPSRPLDKARWGGCVDTVGGATLAAVLSQTARHGTVAACGLAGGHTLETTVYPFILRGVVLAGIDSNTCPNGRRDIAWGRLANEIPGEQMKMLRERVIGLDDVAAASERITTGGVQGRVVVDVNV